MKEKVAVRTSQVTIISIWSKYPEIGRDNVTYTVTVPTGESAEQTLEEAFGLTNRDDRPMGNQACATSSGDIMVLDGVHYLVEGCGFHRLTETESTKIQALTSRDTSAGYAFMVKHNVI